MTQPNKYEAFNDNYFNFDIFEDIFKVINERAGTTEDHMFKAGVASAEAAVRRLREEYYEKVKKMYIDDENYNDNI